MTTLYLPTHLSAPTNHPPLGRKEICFIVLANNPDWIHRALPEDDSFTATVNMAGIEKSVVFKRDEFNTFRAEFILRRLENKDRFRKWVEALLFAC